MRVKVWQLGKSDVSYSIRLERDDEDRRFIESLNPRLTDVIKAPTHTPDDVRAFQDAFTATAWQVDDEKSATFLAVDEAGDRIGYISVREGSDDVLNEPCGYIALLAIKQEHEGRGIAKSLVKQAETWAKGMGFSRLALDVFTSNDHGLVFYQRAGFQPETVRVIKRL
ncbi:GNAT family N-acetyltransferase [Novosphingobium sp. RD2P27]|uniref:GNAT family N-acetyltransferase n=1 Tax=Novosphingobium kalidii TaxID=3230299 RepID=A0ABV2CWE7_9SPHN